MQQIGWVSFLQTRQSNEYGLRAAERNAESNKIVSVASRFCVMLGKEENLGEKSPRMSRVKFFKAPLRTDSYKSHI